VSCHGRDWPLAHWHPWECTVCFAGEYCLKISFKWYKDTNQT